MASYIAETSGSCNDKTLSDTCIYMQWYDVAGVCRNSLAGVCVKDRMLHTQDIAPSTNYSMRVFMNITYSFTPHCWSDCNGGIELQLMRYTGLGQDTYYDNASITPNNIISSTPISGTKHMYFDFNVTEKRFALVLISQSSLTDCVLVSRVLVYQHTNQGNYCTIKLIATLVFMYTLRRNISGDGNF